MDMKNKRWHGKCEVDSKLMLARQIKGRLLLFHCAARPLPAHCPHTVFTVFTVFTASAILGSTIAAVVLATQTVFEITLFWVALVTLLLSTRNPYTEGR